MSGPPSPMKIDLEIARRCGTTAAVEATKERLQVMKKLPLVSLEARYEEVIREKGQLLQELGLQIEKVKLAAGVEEGVNQIISSLRSLIQEFKDDEEKIEREFQRQIEF
jgi:ketopantoate hydroxymethyltransferase